MLSKSSTAPTEKFAQHAEVGGSISAVCALEGHVGHSGPSRTTIGLVAEQHQEPCSDGEPRPLHQGNVAHRLLVVSWKPGRRKAQLSLETPYEGVPEHLATPLWAWVSDYLADPGLVTQLGIEFRVVLPHTDTRSGHSEAIRLIGQTSSNDGGFFLDVVEYVLEMKCRNGRHRADWQGAKVLEHILELANSAYRVKEDCSGLEERTTPEVQQQVQAVVNAATGSAGDHLAAAWNEAYTRKPDPVKSYSESIKAAEAALAQHVSPQNAKQTLGTMIRDINAKPSKWKFAMNDSPNADGVQMVLAIMRQLWEGQTSRHGGVGPTRPETVEEAQAAVHLAAALVQFGVSGAFSTV